MAQHIKLSFIRSLDDASLVELYEQARCKKAEAVYCNSAFEEWHKVVMKFHKVVAERGL